MTPGRLHQITEWMHAHSIRSLHDAIRAGLERAGEGGCDDTPDISEGTTP